MFVVCGYWFSLTSGLTMFTLIIAGLCLVRCDEFIWSKSWPIDNRRVHLVKRADNASILPTQPDHGLYRSHLEPQRFFSNSLIGLSLVTESRQDICDQHCTCERGHNSFVTVTCDFHENPKVSERINLTITPLPQTPQAYDYLHVL